MKHKILIVGFCTITAATAKAQFSDSVHNYIMYAATGIINKTNSSRSYLISNAAQYKLRIKKNALNFAAGYIYGRQQGVLSHDDFNTTVDFNFFPKDSSKLYYWGLLNFDKSFSLNIIGRSQVGIGVAYNFMDDEKRFLNISNGILYEYSNVQLSDGVHEKNDLIRNSFRLRYRFLINKIIIISGTNMLQTAFGHSEDYILKLDNSINLTLNTWLRFRTAFTYNRNNLTKRENMLITLGLTAEKFF